jgi:hypothetical protein
VMTMQLMKMIPMAVKMVIPMVMMRRAGGKEEGPHDLPKPDNF